MVAAPEGKFLWTELMTTQPEAAIAYYQEVVGWGTAKVERGDPTYTMLTAGGRPVGGITDLPDAARASGASAHWLSYIGAADVDRTAEQAVSLGAEVLVPPRFSPVPRSARPRPSNSMFIFRSMRGDSPARFLLRPGPLAGTRSRSTLSVRRSMRAPENRRSESARIDAIHLSTEVAKQHR